MTDGPSPPQCSSAETLRVCATFRDAVTTRYTGPRFELKCLAQREPDFALHMFYLSDIGLAQLHQPCIRIRENPQRA